MRYFSYILTFALVILIANNTNADQRTFVWTYQYQTLKPGEAEFEQYTTLSTPRGNQFERKTSIEHQFELEVGMTPRYDFSIYQVFKQAAGGNYRYEAFKLRGRYRLGDEAGSWVKPILYFEYKANQNFTAQKVEFKPIVGMQGDPYIIAINPKLEWEKKGKAEAKILWGYSGAIGYKIYKLLAFGVELSGSKKGHYFGPTISHGTEHLWVSLGAGYLTSKVDPADPVDEIKIRLLIGVGIPNGKE